MIRTWSLVGAALLWLLTTIGSGSEPNAAPGYVLLRDRAVLRGTVEEEPGRVIIRYRGSEIRMSREKVACWADTLDGLYQYQLDRRRVFTVESHLDAARWCLRHGLCDRAAAEIVAASRLRPNAAEIRRAEAELRLVFQQLVAAEASRGQELSDGEHGTLTASTDESKLSNSAAASEELDDSELLDGIGQDQLREFNLRIQPLLANRCSAAACHGDGAEAAWVLVAEPSPGRRPTAEMTRKNLAAVLPWINRQHPTASPLLVRALKAHGGAEEPPLQPHDQEAVENLRRWIALLPSEEGLTTENASPLVLGAEPTASPGSPAESTVGMMGGKTNQPVRLPDVPDPFDPELFNRRFHPETR